LSPLLQPSHRLRHRGSANDRLRVAIVGLRGRGRDLIKGFNEVQNRNVEIAAFCDVDQSVMRQRAADFEKETNLRPALLDDMRRAMDDKSIDAIRLRHAQPLARSRHRLGLPGR